MDYVARIATAVDFDAIVRIRESLLLDLDQLTDPRYRVRAQFHGYLLPEELSLEEFTQDFSSYLILEVDSKVAGYLALDADPDITIGSKTFTWFDISYSLAYLARPHHASIGGIGILPMMKRRGMATKLLQVAEHQTRAHGISYLFSFVTLAPLPNLASIMFHERNGFKRAAVQEPSHALGLDGYQTLLYMKKV